MIQLVDELFAKDILKVSTTANDFVEFAWTLYKIGGFVPLDVLSYYTDIEDKVNIMSKVGVVSWSTAGVGMDFSKKAIAVSLENSFSAELQRGIDKDKFREILFDKFGKDMIRYCKTGLTKSISYMIAYTIKMAEPDKPVLSSKIARLASNTGIKPLKESSNILSFYMDKFLGLIKFEGERVNLSEKSVNTIKNNSFLWNAYQIEYKDKDPDAPQIVDDSKYRDYQSENIQKSLKSQFPWMSLKK